MKRRPVIFCLFCLISMAAGAQTFPGDSIGVPIEFSPPFQNQGELERYRAQESFKKDASRRDYLPFRSNLLTDSRNLHFKIENLYIDDPDLKSIFTSGLIYQQLFNGVIYSVTNVEELKFLAFSSKVKRFWCWIYRDKMALPSVYLFELTNEDATSETSLKEFIQSAKVTFFRKGWLIF